MHHTTTVAIVALICTCAVTRAAPPLSEEPRVQQEIRAAGPVIAALDKFRREQGHHPAKLEDLVPRYLSSRNLLYYAPKETFRYTFDDSGYMLEFVPQKGLPGVLSCVYLSSDKKWHRWGPY